MTPDERPAGGHPGSVAPGGALLDVNVEVQPFELVERLLHRVACFHLFTRPASGDGDSAEMARGTARFRISQPLRSFQVESRVPGEAGWIATSNSLGPVVGRLDADWQPIDEDHRGRPGHPHPAVPLDPGRSQRFATPELRVTLGDRDRSGFRGYSAGRTFPATSPGGPRLWLTGAGVILEGFGRLAGRGGTYTISGWVGEGGLSLDVVARVSDHDGSLDGAATAAAPEDGGRPRSDVTYLMLLGQKDRHRPTTIATKNGRMEGLELSQYLRSVRISTRYRGPGALRSSLVLGPVVGKMRSTVLFDPMALRGPGTPESPDPFQSRGAHYRFFDAAGREAGGFRADVIEARQFKAPLPGASGIPSLRFVGFGPIREGTGQFAEVQGMLTFNSAGTLNPHVLFNLYTVGLWDPTGRFHG